MKSLLASICILGVVGLVIGVMALAASEQGITASVCPELVSLTVSPNSVDYGVLALGATDQAPAPAYVTVANNGNVTEDFTIKGADAVASPSGTWSLCWTGGACTIPGIDKYVHEFSTDAWTTPHELTTSYQTLQAGIVGGVCDGTGGSSVTTHLRIDTPTSTSVYDDYSASVTILATKS